jgi:hypothetical protein
VTEQPEYVIYADTTKPYQSRAIRPGRLVARAPQIEPDRWSHAAAPGSEVTLCGTPIAGLKDFSDRLFRNINPYLRCSECNEVAGNPSP